MESKIQYRQFGEGECIILLHGFAGSVSHWDRLRHLLSKYHRVVVPNLTHLTLGAERLTFSRQVDELKIFIQSLKVSGPIHLVGLSYGGALAWALAMRYPNLVTRVVLINPMPPFPIRHFQWRALRLFLRLPLRKTLTALALKTEWGRQFLRRAAEIFRNVANEPSLDRVSQLEGRKLLFVAHLIERFAWIVRSERWGMWANKLEYWTPETLFICDDEDPLIRFDAYEEMFAKMGCEHFFVTEGAGHISTLNSPELITWEVLKFFQDHKPVTQKVAAER